jgi:hypothetical protein
LGGKFPRRDGFAPFGGEYVVVDPEGLTDLGHPIPEVALGQDQDPVARPYGIEQSHFHGQRPRAGDDEGFAPVAESDLLEISAGLLEVASHLGADVRHRGQGQGVEDARHDRARAGDEEQLFFGHRGPLGRKSRPL